MLAISLEPGEYLTINGDIVVKLSKIARGRCFLAIEADRSVPIVRGAVLERNGTPPPTCIQKPPRKKSWKPGLTFRWDDSRERAVNKLEALACRLEDSGAKEDAKLLRTQLEQIVPAVWEDALN